MRDRWHDMAQTMRRFAVLTNFVPLKCHDLVTIIAGHCGNKIRASVRLVLVLTATTVRLIIWHFNVMHTRMIYRQGTSDLLYTLNLSETVR